MESLQQNITELSQHFNARMAEFQKSVQSSAIPATSPTSNIVAQFSVFRNFVLSSLDALQKQVDLLNSKYEDLEMRTRRKILLVHGVQETKNENLTSTVIGVLSEQLNIPDLKDVCLSRCNRLGKFTSGRPRAIIIKFHDIGLRNKVWFAKKGLKNTGITLSEFLTKGRHDVFLAARQRLGTTKCWTKYGQVVVLMADGSRKQITSMTDLNSLSTTDDPDNTPSNMTASTSSNISNAKVAKVVQASRPKRFASKK